MALLQCLEVVVNNGGESAVNSGPSAAARAPSTEHLVLAASVDGDSPESWQGERKAAKL